MKKSKENIRYLHYVAFGLFGLFIFANVLFFTSDICYACKTTINSSKGVYQTIPQSSWKEFEGKENVVILDIRTLEEFNSGHIDNAVNIDYYGANFKDELSKLDRDKIYLVYCRSGHRGKLSLPIFEELNFTEVYNLEGGFSSLN